MFELPKDVYALNLMFPGTHSFSAVVNARTASVVFLESVARFGGSSFVLNIGNKLLLETNTVLSEHTSTQLILYEYLEGSMVQLQTCDLATDSTIPSAATSQREYLISTQGLFALSKVSNHDIAYRAVLLENCQALAFELLLGSSSEE